jgi:hypothetical protein
MKWSNVAGQRPKSLVEGIVLYGDILHPYQREVFFLRCAGEARGAVVRLLWRALPVQAVLGEAEDAVMTQAPTGQPGPRVPVA